MRRTLSAMLLSALAAGAHAVDIGGVEFPEHVELAGTTLVFNGGGVRTRFLFDVYAIALYLPEKTSEASRAIGSSGPRRIAITPLRDVDARTFADALRAGIAANHTAAQTADMAPRVDALAALLHAAGGARTGVAITLDGLPQGLTRVVSDGAVLGEIEDRDFHAALSRIWLGPEPVQDDLKQALLGGVGD